MQINKVSIKNFLSFGNHTETITVNELNFALSLGKNGHGKSSFMEAITFGLYGKALRKINKNDLVNNINKKDSLVTVEFDVNDDSYKVIRGIKPNVFEIHKNNELLNQSSTVMDYQYILESEIIGISYDMFKQLVVLAGASYTPFFDMNTNNRRAILEELLSLQELSEMEQVLKGFIAENKQTIGESNAAINELVNVIRSTNETLKKSTETNKEKIESLKSELNELDKEIKRKRDDNASLKQQVIDKQVDINDLKVKIHSTSELIRASEKEIHVLQHRIESQEEHLRFLNDHSQCTTCKQTISHEYRSAAEESVNAVIRDIRADNDKLQSEINDLNAELSQSSSLLKDITVIAKEIQTNNQIIQNIQEKQSAKLDLLDSLSQSSDNSLLRADLIKLGDRYTEIQEKLNALNDKQADYMVTKQLLSDDGIRKGIISKYIPYITGRINHWLKELELLAKVEISDTFEETIKMRGFDVVKFASCSQGEKARLNLATLMAFRELTEIRTNQKINFLALDEIAENLDVDGKTKLLYNLKSITKEQGINILFVSHDIGLSEDIFDTIVHVKKHGNFSKVTISS